jgi:hypothetical protein
MGTMGTAQALLRRYSPDDPSTGQANDLTDRLTEALQQQAPQGPSGKWESVPQTNEYGRVTPDLPLEQPQGSSQNDHLDALLGELVSKYQSMQDPTPRHGIKGLLTNFFQGGGEALMRSQGMETAGDQKSKLLTQIFHLRNAQVLYQGQLAENELKKAQVANATRPLSPEQAAATGNPQLAGQVVPSDVMSSSSAEQSRQQDAKQAAQAQAQNTPTISLPLDANTAKLAGVPDKFVGQNLSAADWKLIDARLTAQGYQKMDMGRDGKDGGIWIVDRGGNKVNQVTPVSESARALKAMTAAAEANKPTNIVTGTSLDGRQVAGTLEELTSTGVTGITKLPSGDASKVYIARQLISPDGLITNTERDIAAFQPEELTAIGSRWNEFMTGKLGSGDPRYVALRTDTQLLSTALMQAHVGSRGSEGMMEHFGNMANAGKMDAGTLKAAITTERRYVTEKAMMSKKASGGSSPTANPGGAFNWNSFPAVKP